ncbi:Flp pilus assembly protein CpaB [Anaerosinus massiliensis]|uniref:Flp pilus assembly protein CpaB n=1 Tax=Massilibacillus massiliensis TaxID=1806837 RepID=UPI000AE0759B|nr:Flp pilus assembly protein CpaB [Massilibacillus massiliensis]
MNLPELPRNFTEKLEKMTSKQLLLLAFVTSIIVTIVIYLYLAGKEAEPVQKSQTLRTVIVATVDIPERTIIREDMLKVVHLPADVMQADAIIDLSSVIGKVAKFRILQGDVLTEQKLFSNRKMEGFIGAIPDDKRAISIPVTDITGVSGFAKPGDYVDIMLISDKLSKNTISGEILLQNILLLAINKEHEVAEGKKENAKEQLTTATIAVSPEDVVKIAAAQSQGTIYLALRPFKPKNTFILMNRQFYRQLARDEDKPEKTASSVTENVPRSAYPDRMQAQAAPLAIEPPRGDAVKSSHQITVIRGNAADTVQVK